MSNASFFHVSEAGNPTVEVLGVTPSINLTIATGPRPWRSEVTLCFYEGEWERFVRALACSPQFVSAMAEHSVERTINAAIALAKATGKIARQLAEGIRNPAAEVLLDAVLSTGYSCPWCESTTPPVVNTSAHDHTEDHLRRNPFYCAECGGFGGREDWAVVGDEGEPALCKCGHVAHEHADELPHDCLVQITTAPYGPMGRSSLCPCIRFTPIERTETVAGV